MSLLHAHLVFVTNYRRKVFTHAMLTYCQTTMAAVCADLRAELVEFNGEADHVHPLVSYPPTGYPSWQHVPPAICASRRDATGQSNRVIDH